MKSWYETAVDKGLITEGKTAKLPPVTAQTPNSVTVKELEPSEASWQLEVILTARAYGWKDAHFRKVRVQRASGSTYWETPVGGQGKGWPDLVLVKGTRLIFAELKVGKNTTTPEQKVWLELLGAIGGPVEVYEWRPKDRTEIVKILSA